MGNKVGGKKKLQKVMFKDSSLKFDATELQELKMKFETFAERSKGPTVDKGTFLKVFPLPGILGERLFTLFDVDGSGVLDYEEFICGLALFCRGSQEERLRVMFNMYDLAGDGAIHKKELGILLSHMPKGILEASVLARKIRNNSFDKAQTNEVGEERPPVVKVGNEASVVDVQQLVERAFEDCDLNRDGKLSYHQFNLWVNQNPDLAGWLDHQMNEQVFEAAGILPGSKKNSHGRPGYFSEALNSPQAIAEADKAPFGFECRHCRYQYVFCTSCGTKFSAKTECTYTSLDGHGPTDTTKDLNEQENDSMSAVMPEGNMPGVWRIVCDKCNSTSKIGFCGGCGIRAKKETFVNCTISEAHLPPVKVGSDNHLLSPMREFGRSIFSSSKTDQIISARSVTHSGFLFKKGGRFGAWKRRFYWINGKFCYYTKSSKKMEKPHGAIYLEGAYISALKKNLEDATAPKYFGIEIQISNGGERDIRWLYASTLRDQEQWILALKSATDTKAFQSEYNILQQIGAGRFSKVYRCAKKTEGKDQYAVKVMIKDSMDDKELELLRTEIAVMKLMSHPNIISLEDIYESKTKIHIVMELVHGGELFQHIVGRKRFSEQETYKLIEPIANALKYMHSLGVVHRDLKPENILCEKGLKNIRIADFGLSQLVAPTVQLKLACGTLSYVAPEVLSSLGYGSPADIWSLGVIAYLVIRGKLPYTAKTQEQTVLNIQESKNVIKLDDKYWNKCSPECCDVVSRMLDKDPLTRITASEILTHEWGRRMSKESKLLV